MNKIFLRILVLFFICLLFILIKSAKSSDKTRTVEITIGSPISNINGQEQSPMVLPVFIEKGRTIVPIRFISEDFEIDTTTKNLGKLAIFKSKNVLIEMPLNSNIVKVNGIDKQIEVPVFIKNNRTVVPVRFIMETFGALVTWEPTLQKVTIEYTKPDEL